MDSPEVYQGGVLLNAADVTPGRYVLATVSGIQVVGLERYPLSAESAEVLAGTLKSLVVFQRALREGPACR